MGASAGAVDTPDILTNTEFRYFWITWSDGVIRVGHGFIIGEDIIMEKNYPTSTDINYLALFNGMGSDGIWKLYTGIACTFIYTFVKKLKKKDNVLVRECFIPI